MEVDLIKTLSKYGEEFHDLISRLSAITILDEGEKLSIYDNVLYIDGTWYPSIQMITRYIMNQGRIYIYKFLKKEFESYHNLIRSINCYDSVTRFDVELRRDLLAKSKVFFENAKMGILVLKMTYPNYKELHEILDRFTNDINTVHLGFSPKLQCNN